MSEPGSRWRILHHVLGAIVVFAWMAALLWRLSAHADKGMVDIGASPGDSAGQRSYAVYYQAQKIGFTESERIARSDGGALFKDRALWQFRAQGSLQKLVLSSEAEVDSNWHLLSIRAHVDAGLARFSATGKIVDNVLELDLQSRGQVQHQRIELDGPIMVSGAVRAYVAARKPEAGDAFSLDIYNPLTRGPERIEIVVEEKLEQGYRISEIMHASTKTSAIIDFAGMTIEERNPLGFVLQAEPREQALKMPQGSDVIPDLVFSAAVPLSGDLELLHASPKTLLVKIDGVDVKKYTALDGDGQRLEGNNTLSIERIAPESLAKLTLPLDQDVLRDNKAELAQALVAAPLLQVNDPGIQKRAHMLAPESTDALEVVTAIADFVYRKMKKASNVGVPNAVDILEDMQGDCNEHTVLFTALARARGVPTRMAAGLVYVDKPGMNSSMFYHAWPEVWLGRWLAIDPTFGQIPADATHIRFVVGGLEHQAHILSLIGAISVEILAPSTPSSPQTNEARP